LRAFADGNRTSIDSEKYLTKVRYMLDPISRVRRFNRAVTSEVGALDTSFLGRGRPLGAARVLNAIGHGRSDVAEIRDYLGLDSGLMSRLLRALEDEGLIETTAHADDARRRARRVTNGPRYPGVGATPPRSSSHLELDLPRSQEHGGDLELRHRRGEYPAPLQIEPTEKP